MAKKNSPSEATGNQNLATPTTQRAYTLRLRPAISRDDPPEEAVRKTREMQDALWATHEAVNKGARVFGDWLLTLRGGLSHELAEPPPGKGKKRSAEELAAIRKNRRILLALSWLNVEDERGAPGGSVRVATGQDADLVRGNELLAALCAILSGRRVGKREIEDWVADCGDSLAARIREDAVWVDRSACFDQRCTEFKGLSRDYATEITMTFFGPSEDYFALPDVEAEQPGPGGASEGPEFRILARQWCSTNFGTGEKSDTGTIVDRLRRLARADLSRFAGGRKTDLIAHMSKRLGGRPPDVDGLRIAIGWKTGRPSSGRLAIDRLPARPTKAAIESMQATFDAEANAKEAAGGTRRVPAWMPSLRAVVEQKCGMRFKVGEGRDYIGEFSVMLDHAARRVSIAHSWTKRAEARRRGFEEDAKRLNKVPPAASAWLDRFVQNRGQSSGAIAAGGAYRIRGRAIEGWDEVVKYWNRLNRFSEAALERLAANVPLGTSSGTDTLQERARIAAARELQSDPVIDKFGDIQLFETLADDNAGCVWRIDGKADPQILKDYVHGHDARDKMRRFKIPVYRHPDPLRHPVFCDFGNSRWNIKFACHEAAKARAGGKRAVKEDGQWIGDRHALRMGLWNGKLVDDVGLCWSCKRLVTDLALDAASKADAVAVTRADRPGRASAGAFDAVTIRNVFEEKDWNGRLQAPRAQLDRIARHLEKRKHKQAEALLRQTRWLISFSPRLRPSGPFIEYAAAHGIEPNRRGEYYPNAPTNKGRDGLAKLALARLPGLRVLAVDLGHRFAAACAVWETLTTEAFRKETRGLKVVAGSSGKAALFLHVEQPGRDGRPRTIVYRRIGEDFLRDPKTGRLSDNPHPAPWARLDRQFLVKLQGEEQPARRAAPHETDAVRRWENAVGRVRDETGPNKDRDALPNRVDMLMSEAVTSLTRALRRHGDRARIAFNLTAKVKLTPGGGQQVLDRAARVELLAQTLGLWRGLFSGKRWADTWAADEWKKLGLPEIAAPDETEDASGAARRTRRAALENVLKPVAERLADQDLSAWSALWKQRWESDDATWLGKDGILRTLKRWIAPRGLRPLATDDDAVLALKKAARARARHVGGLSVCRINTLSGLYQLLKAFKMRPEPDDPRKNVPKKADDELVNFNRRLLDIRDRIREQRVKQLASRVVEAALGIGRVKGDSVVAGAARPRQRTDRPCHAVVIESLTHYRPDDLRTRRENRMLMQWSSSKVQKYLKEGCQLYGLHLREVPANYTSRQCSRTGLPGIRCDDVPVEEFLTAPWWKKAVKAAQKKVNDKNSADAEARFLIDLHDSWAKRREDERKGRVVRVPRQGGDLFVAAPPTTDDQAADSASSQARRAIQADLNAAANIGLRALLDPDFPGRWWYVPCRDSDGAPVTNKVMGAACFGPDVSQFGALRNSADRDGTAENKGSKSKRAPADRPKVKEITNFWADPSARELRPAANNGRWLETPAYWPWVKKRVINGISREFNGLGRADGNGSGLDPDDAPW